MVLGTLPAAFALVILTAPVEPEDSASLVEVKVTQKYLVPLCLDGAPAKPGERRWRLAVRAHSLAFTMRNQPHQGAKPHQKVDPQVGPGVATISFTPEAGHRYEVETRTSAAAFASRVWEQGKWKPVVRDRTVDRIVSGEPEWRDAACQPGGMP